MAVVLIAAFMRRRLTWAGALPVLALAASPLVQAQATPAFAATAINGITASLQLPGEQLPDKLPVAAISLSEAGLEALRTTGQRPRPTPPADHPVFQRRLEDVLHAAATETGVRHAQRRLQAYPLDPPLRLLNPGNAPPLA